MRPYLVESIDINSGGVRYRVSDLYPCLSMALKAFDNLKNKSLEIRLYQCCLDFDRLIDEYPQSK